MGLLHLFEILEGDTVGNRMLEESRKGRASERHLRQAQVSVDSCSSEYSEAERPLQRV